MPHPRSPRFALTKIGSGQRKVAVACAASFPRDTRGYDLGQPEAAEADWARKRRPIGPSSLPPFKLINSQDRHAREQQSEPKKTHTFPRHVDYGCTCAVISNWKLDPSGPCVHHHLSLWIPPKEKKKIIALEKIKTSAVFGWLVAATATSGAQPTAGLAGPGYCTAVVSLGMVNLER